MIRAGCGSDRWIKPCGCHRSHRSSVQSGIIGSYRWRDLLQQILCLFFWRLRRPVLSHRNGFRLRSTRVSPPQCRRLQPTPTHLFVNHRVLLVCSLDSKTLARADRFHYFVRYWDTVAVQRHWTISFPRHSTASIDGNVDIHISYRIIQITPLFLVWIPRTVNDHLWWYRTLQVLSSLLSCRVSVYQQICPNSHLHATSPHIDFLSIFIVNFYETVDAVGGSSSSSMASSNPAPHLVSASHSAPMASSTDQTQNVAHGHHVSDQSMLTLPAGAQLIIPVGSAIILPAGTMIQYQPGTVLKEDVTGMAGHQMSHGTASPMEATHSHGGSGAHSHS